MKALTKTLFSLMPIAGIGAAFYYAPHFLWQMAFNMKTPITFFSLLVGALALLVIHDSRRHMKKLGQFDHEYGNLEFRAWTAVNVAAICGLMWLLDQSVPTPDFAKQIVYQDRVVMVTKQVPVLKYAGLKTEYKIPTYSDAYDQCKQSLAQNSSLSNEQAVLCHKQATEAALPPYRTMTRTLYQPSNYWDVFNKCNEAHDINVKGQSEQVAIDNRNKRMLICQQIAHDASSVH